MALALYLIIFFTPFLLHFHTFVSIEAVDMISQPGCPSKCGNVSIPYPFGIGPDCSFGIWSNVTCDTEYDPPVPFIRVECDLEDEEDPDLYEVVEFLPSEIRVKSKVASTCSPLGDHRVRSNFYYFLSQPYTFSPKSKITVIGCNADVKADTSMTREEDTGMIHGPTCPSICNSPDAVIDGESCTGRNGCCQTEFQEGTMELDLTIQNMTIPQTEDSIYGNVYINQSFNPCYSAFVVDRDRYTFKRSHLSNVSAIEEESTFLFNYNVGNKTCTDAEKDPATFACKDNNSHCYEQVSDCDEPDHDSPGYLCNCSNGYQGNPYLSGGCKDINECEHENICEYGGCKNTEGSYSCSCPPDSYGEMKKDGSGCIPRKRKSLVLQLSLGIGFGLLFVVIGSVCLCMSIKRRKLSKHREKLFQRNGGSQLKEQISSQKIFTAKELESATNNFDQHQVLGKGSFGTVYKGFIPELGTVAIKKSRSLEQRQIGEFINEVSILTQIDHRNIVKLLGCCLEVEAPLLVYEFVSNGTLSQHIHKESDRKSIMWEIRLRIAAEIAGALAYLHSAASTPIIHRDVKSANILLDENLTAKVADFGASRLNPEDQTQIDTIVKGTLGYLDPEYYHTSVLTEKSDVYSFGVVLAELLTGELVISSQRSQEQKYLATYFTASMKEDNLFRLLDVEISDEGNIEQVQAVAGITIRCLNVKGENRPTMKEVAAELEGLRGFERHALGKQRNEETVEIESTQMDLYAISSSSYGDGMSGQYSLEMGMMSTMNFPR